MKRISLFTFSLAIFCITFLFSCKDEETKPLIQFQTNGKTYSLSKANLYLRLEGTYEGTTSNYTYRDYMISDGQLKEGENGWSVDDYTNATYFIAFELATIKPNSISPGNFPLHRFWNNVTDGSNLSYFFADFEGVTYDTPDSNPSPVFKISGGTEPNEKMTVEFTGKIAIRAEGGALTPLDGKVNFMGTIIDKRD
ncbi:MAG: hypothetical protein ACK5WF_10565 [Cyclobacteriaceae bacterium]